MTARQTIELRRSEIRQRLGAIAELDGDGRTDAIASEQTSLMVELRESEPRLQAAIAAEESDTRLKNPGDGEGAEHRALVGRASLGDIFAAVLEHRAAEGATRELQEHLGLGANQVPLDLLEHRAVTPAPADVGQNMAAIVPGVFPESVAAFLGIDMPRVGTGEAIYPVLTQNAEVKTPAENAAATETTGAFSADVLTPARLQASFFYSREDRARFVGMDSALRENLSMALADGLDKEVVAGTNGLLTGTNLANHAVAAETTFAIYKSQLLYGRVDGTYAAGAGDIRLVLGAGTYAHAAGQYRATENNFSALDVLMQAAGGVRVSAHVPAVASNEQNALVRLGMRRDMVAPVWEGVTLIPDEITKAGNGQIVITAVLLYAVKVLRAGGSTTGNPTRLRAWVDGES